MVVVLVMVICVSALLWFSLCYVGCCVFMFMVVALEALNLLYSLSARVGRESLGVPAGVF